MPEEGRPSKHTRTSFFRQPKFRLVESFRSISAYSWLSWLLFYLDEVPRRCDRKWEGRKGRSCDKTHRHTYQQVLQALFSRFGAPSRSNPVILVCSRLLGRSGAGEARRRCRSGASKAGNEGKEKKKGEEEAFISLLSFELLSPLVSSNCVVLVSTEVELEEGDSISSAIGSRRAEERLANRRQKSVAAATNFPPLFFLSLSSSLVSFSLFASHLPRCTRPPNSDRVHCALRLVELVDLRQGTDSFFGSLFLVPMTSSSPSSFFQRCSIRLSSRSSMFR